MNGIERMQCNIQSDAITLTTLKYSAAVIVHILVCTRRLSALETL